MNCEKVQRRISAYAAESLSKRFSGRIATHLEECSECRAVLQLDRMVMEMVESLQPLGPPAGLYPPLPNHITSRRALSAGHRALLLQRARWAFALSVPALVLVLARTTLIPPQQTDPSLYEYAQGHMFYAGQEILADRPALYTASLLADAAHQKLEGKTP